MEGEGGSMSDDTPVESLEAYLECLRLRNLTDASTHGSFTATAVCAQCLYESKGFCCGAHAPDHDCGEDMLLPVVNSPRMGVCGYSGEA
jgi:hypothetical protein